MRRRKCATFWSVFTLIITSFLCQVMVTNVTSLLKTVKAVEDEATRGTRALEATIECIKQELTVRVVSWSTESLFFLLLDQQKT